ncbi:hypothetical protein [Croceicoccus marinus]|jgi:hypothetical protein|uniref:Uncharacterized protein n=1 Tax=Croceicoccus marinus TaxID=450378 RepID=A0A7G6VZQ9_9SPHN|nr:hypothetical protein [Croceicoccus marinus]QNE07224.1 hypothetical protein H4O24_14990 [Croceicoccus marinus]
MGDGRGARSRSADAKSEKRVLGVSGCLTVIGLIAVWIGAFLLGGSEYDWDRRMLLAFYADRDGALGHAA